MKRTEGWGSIWNSPKAHYFVEGRALCGRWLTLGSPHWESNQTTGKAPDSGTCRGCWTKRVKAEAKRAAVETQTPAAHCSEPSHD